MPGCTRGPSLSTPILQPHSNATPCLKMTSGPLGSLGERTSSFRSGNTTAQSTSRHAGQTILYYRQAVRGINHPPNCSTHVHIFLNKAIACREALLRPSGNPPARGQRSHLHQSICVDCPVLLVNAQLLRAGLPCDAHIQGSAIRHVVHTVEVGGIPRQGRLARCHRMSAATHLICGLEGMQ